ncbi:MAG: hypothetical protein KDA91_11245 [Planctomycetaceae bacterium]|nr:hypothetical protein [Planctomycetaceae bacterium]
MHVEPIVAADQPSRLVSGAYCWRITLVLASVATLAILLCPFIPLGVPDEWTWTRHAFASSAGEWMDRFLPGIVVGILLFILAVFGDRRISKYGQIRHALLIIALTLLTVAWQNAAGRSAPTPHREVKSWWIVYDRFASGYFYEAAFKINSMDELLTGYEERMAEGDVLHVGTHPPGLFMLCVTALNLTHNQDSFVDVLRNIRSRETEILFRELEATARMNRPLSQAELAALQLVSSISILFAAMSVIPVYLLASTIAGRTSGWRAACLCATIPTLVIFTPKSDVIFAFTGTLFLWLTVVAGLTSHLRVRILSSLAAGILLFAGMLLSLAHLPCIVVAFAFAVLQLGQNQATRPRSIFAAVGMMVLSWAGCVLLFDVITDCNLLNVWRMNLMNHEGFYETSPRTWWIWTLVNPLELTLAVGGALMLAGGRNVFDSFRILLRNLRSNRSSSMIPSTDQQLVKVRAGTLEQDPNEAGSPSKPNPGVPAIDSACSALMVSMAATWVILWLSGKNMGEAARLWCFLVPWIAIVAGCSFRHLPFGQSGSGQASYESDKTNFSILIGLQIVCSLITVSVVNGFSV